MRRSCAPVRRRRSCSSRSSGVTVRVPLGRWSRTSRDRDLGHRRLGVLVGAVEARLEDTPREVGLVEPVVDTGVLLRDDTSEPAVVVDVRLRVVEARETIHPVDGGEAIVGDEDLPVVALGRDGELARRAPRRRRSGGCRRSRPAWWRGRRLVGSTATAATRWFRGARGSSARGACRSGSSPRSTAASPRNAAANSVGSMSAPPSSRRLIAMRASSSLIQSHAHLRMSSRFTPGSICHQSPVWPSGRSGAEDHPERAVVGDRQARRGHASWVPCAVRCRLAAA